MSLENQELSSQHLNYRDPLTNLFNRRYLHESLPKEIQRASQTQSSIGIVLMNVDHFKSINDIFGHSFGDLALQVLAKVIIQNVRDKDIVCRIGGKEFVIIFPDTSLQDTYELAKEIQQKVNNLIIYNEASPAQMTISLGVACFPENGTTDISLIDFADRALYMAKCQRDKKRPDTSDRTQEYSKMSLAIPGEIEPFFLGHFKDDLETFALVKTIAVESKSEQVSSAAAVRSIRGLFSSHPKTFGLLKSIAVERKFENVSPAAVEAIALYFSSDLETFALLKTIAVESNSLGGAAAAVEAIAHYFSHYPEALSLLKTIAIERKSEPVASAAVWVIAEYFSHHLETLSFLKTIAIERKSEPVASAAVEAIAHYFSHYPETLFFLKTIAVEDKSEPVASEAVEAIAHYFSSHPELSFLETIAIERKSEPVASEAVEVDKGWARSAKLIAHYFSSHPETLSLLRTIAVESKSKWGSAAAVEAIARHFSSHPETLSLLRTIAVENKSEWGSEAALREIASHCRNHPEIIALESQAKSRYIYRGVIIPTQYGQTLLSQWQPSWLLTETNAEVRKALIQGIGYEKIICSLNAVTLDNYREYSLMRIVIPSETEPILLLKMTCPSTGHLHVLRVPPNMTSAHEAICWVNWGIAPEDLAIET